MIIQRAQDVVDDLYGVAVIFIDTSPVGLLLTVES
jgi:hypothetical protein